MIIPKLISFKLWASQLIIDYPKDMIPIVLNEKDWKEWGASLIESDSFKKANAPAPTTEKNWDEWAMKVYQAMN